MNHTKKKQSAAMWICCGVAGVTVVLSIIFHRFIFDTLGWAMEFDFSSLPFWSIVCPCIVFLIDNLIFAVRYEVVFFQRANSYWTNVGKQMLFGVVLYALAALFPLFIMIAWGIYCSPVRTCREILLEMLPIAKELYLGYLTHFLPLMFIVTPMAFVFGIFYESDAFFHLGVTRKIYVCLEKFELDGKVFCLMIPRWHPRALMIRKIEVEGDEEYLSRLTKTEFINCYTYKKAFIDDYIQRRKGIQRIDLKGYKKRKRG